MTIADELTAAATQLRALRVDPPLPTRTLRRRSTRRRSVLAAAVVSLVFGATLLARQQDDSNVVAVIGNQSDPTSWCSYGASLLELDREGVTRHEPDPEKFTPIYEVIGIDDEHFAARVANTVTVRSSDGTIVRTIGDGRLIAGPDHSLWLANGLASTISRVDPSTFATEERLTINYPNSSIVAITDRGVLVLEPDNRALAQIAWDGSKTTVVGLPIRYALVNRAGTRIAYALESLPNRLTMASLPTDTQPLDIYVLADTQPVFSAAWSPDDRTLALVVNTASESAEAGRQPHFDPVFVDDARAPMLVPNFTSNEPGQLVWITPTLVYYLANANAVLIDLSTGAPKVVREQAIGGQTPVSSR